MSKHKKSKNTGILAMYGDMCVVGVTTDNKVIVYDKYTNDARTVQMQVFEDLSKRNKIVNSDIDFQRLSIYEPDMSHIVVDNGLYVIGGVVKDDKITAYKVFGSGCKPVNIQIESLMKSDKNFINASVFGGELKVEKF